MTRYHAARTIAASPDTVWDLLTDASSYTQWNPAVVRITGPIAEGSTIELVSVVNPKRTFRLKVTHFAPPRRMVWSDGMPFGLFSGVRTYELDERDGRTEFSMTEEFSGPLAGMITRTIPDMTDSFNAFADGLKSAAESAAR